MSRRPSTASTFNIGDVINGGAGTDTFNVTYVDGTGNALATGLPPGATVSGVEIVNLNITAAGVDVPNAVTSANFAGVQQLWQIDTAVGGAASQNIAVGSGVTAGFRGAGDALNLTVVQSAGATAAIALDGVTTGGGIVINEGTAGTVKTVNVSGSVAGAGAFTVNGAAGTTAVDTYNVSLSSKGTVTLTTDVAVVKTVNFGGSTGDITFVSNQTDAFTTLTGGSGKDTLTVSNVTANAATLVVNAGAGADTINFTNTAGAIASTTTLTGGTGGDTFNIDAIGNLKTAASLANLQANLTTISDFTAAEDVLNLTGGFGTQTTQNTVNIAAVGADLFAVTTSVAGVTAANTFSVFQFGADTYIYANDGVAGLTAGDGLIQLTGVTLGSLTAANFTAA